MKLLWISAKTPIWMHKIIRRILLMKMLPTYSKRLAVFSRPAARSSYDVWEAVAEQKEIRDEILNQWEELRLDALICNVLPVPAPPLDAPTMIPCKTPSIETVMNI